MAQKFFQVVKFEFFMQINIFHYSVEDFGVLAGFLAHRESVVDHYQRKNGRDGEERWVEPVFNAAGGRQRGYRWGVRTGEAAAGPKPLESLAVDAVFQRQQKFYELSDKPSQKPGRQGLVVYDRGECVHIFLTSIFSEMFMVDGSR